MTMENPLFEDIYFLLKMVIFQGQVSFHWCSSPKISCESQKEGEQKFTQRDLDRLFVTIKDLGKLQPRWWLQLFFIFTPKIGEDSHFD